MMRALVITTFLLFFLSNLAGQSKLTRSFKSIKDVVKLDTRADIDSVVQIGLFSAPKASSYSVVSTSVKKGIYELSEKGQKAFIEAANSKVADEKKLVETLGKTIVSIPSPKPFHVEKTKFIKKLEIDVRDMLRGTKRVGRIEELYIKLKLDDTSNITFLGFNNIATKYEVVDFGKIGLTRSQNFTINAGLEVAGTGSTSNTTTSTAAKKTVIDGDTVDISDGVTGVGTTGSSNTSNLGASYALGRTITEERDVKRRRIVLKGTINKYEAIIYQEGAPSVNLNDKISIELLFETVNNESEFILNFSGLYNSDGTVRKGADTIQYKISYGYLTTPTQKVDSISLEYEFIYREVANNKGKKSLGEWDDEVVFLKTTNRDSTRTKYKFISKGELKADSWRIKDGSSNYLYAKYFGRTYQLKFTSLKDATSFLMWLYQTQYTSFNGTRLLKGTRKSTASPLVPSDIPNFIVKKE
ncbi:hypothetical protein FNH22_24360 [Fulvivirga sp. M361]|uniref:hypothetical protein n=1 Tax=Fulvivirga sp. M361 TaxID=2594266 RepID=UPI00117B3C4F|nr:hypothetical protein [Fulvivirga sp. M361]TRX51272.1 hypothetical protein FNH22_24360 [Fulvivirga sp. M361]